MKPSYYAAQHVFSIFDATLERRADYPYTSTVAAPHKLALTGYTQRGGPRQVVALWFNHAPVVEENVVTPIALTLARGDFKLPVLVDLRTGVVYKIPAGQWKKTGAGAEFRGVPVYDSPVLIAEESAIRMIGGAP